MTYIGILAAFINAVFMTAKDTVSKKVSSQIDSAVSTLASFLYALPYYLIVLVIAYNLDLEKFETRAGFYSFIVLRALSDSCAEWFKMRALQVGELSVVVSILALYPAILLVVSPLVTHDHVSDQAVVGTILSIIGTLIILYRPRDSSEKIAKKAVVFAAISAVFMSMNTALDRMAAQTGSALYSGFLMTLLAGLFVLPATSRKLNWKTQLLTPKKLFALRGLFEVLFMVLKLYALQVLAAPIVVGIQRISLFFSILTGRIVFQEKHFLRRLAGGGCVCIGIILIVTGA